MTTEKQIRLDHRQHDKDYSLLVLSHGRAPALQQPVTLKEAYSAARDAFSDRQGSVYQCQLYHNNTGQRIQVVKGLDETTKI